MTAAPINRRNLLRTAAAAGALAATGVPAVATADELSFVPPATEQITPFRVHVPDSALRDLRSRLVNVRLPERETVGDVSQGVPLDRLRALLRHWATGYDWRRLESRLNSLGQYRTRIDGIGIHFLHVRSRHPDATPILLNHGWPGSFVEFLKSVDPLTDPTAYGGTEQDAFHVVIPSMPGYGFSDKPATTGWTPARIAGAYGVLMRRLGYRRYLAQGGDWGGGVTTQMGKQRPAGLVGIHLNFPEYLFAPPVSAEPTPAEQAALEEFQTFQHWYAGYFDEQSTRPQTIGYALADSPSGQAAWIYEKFVDWTDTDKQPERVLSTDDMLDDITLYWLTNTAASSARLYWEYYSNPVGLTTVDLPVGVSVFPGELVRTPRIWAERAYHDLRYFNDTIPAGGHFAAFEQPRLFTEELRRFARTVR